MMKTICICDLCRLEALQMDGFEGDKDIEGKVYIAKITSQAQGIEKTIELHLCENHHSELFVTV